MNFRGNNQIRNNRRRNQNKPVKASKPSRLSGVHSSLDRHLEALHVSNSKNQISKAKLRPSAKTRIGQNKQGARKAKVSSFNFRTPQNKKKFKESFKKLAASAEPRKANVGVQSETLEPENLYNSLFSSIGQNESVEDSQKNIKLPMIGVPLAPNNEMCPC